MPANPRTKPNPKDHTGNLKRILSEQNAEELARRKEELAMHHQESRLNLDVPIPLDSQGRPIQSAPPEPEGPMEIEPERVNIRIACDLEKVTIGQGNHFEFKEGQTYNVPLNVALHLDRLGYVWQWL